MPNITGNVKFNIFYVYIRLPLLRPSTIYNKSVAPLCGLQRFSLLLVYILFYSASDIKGYL